MASLHQRSHRPLDAELIVAHAPDPVFVTDLEGKILQANEAASWLLGFRQDELVDQSLSRFISPDERREVTAALREVVARGVTRNARLNPRTAAGEVIPTTLNASALRDPHGRVIGAIGILRDMRELDKARAYAESLITNAPDPVFVSDLQGKILQANAAVSELLGLRPDELLEQSLSRFLEPEETREFMGALREVVQRGVTRDARLHPRSASGAIIPTTMNAAALRAPDGTVIGAIGILRDMRELDKARAYAESLIKNAPDPVFVSDLEGKILQANDAVFALLGFRPDELIEQSLSRIISSQETRAFLAALREVVECGLTRNARLTPRSASGEVIPTALNASALRDAEGEVIGAIGILRDMRAYEAVVRDLQESQGQLAEANQAKDQFLAVLSHELRTPLQAILGWARLLRTGTLDSAGAGRALDVIERNARVQTQLIDDLLDVSRIVTGKLRLDVRPVDLVFVVEAAIEAVRGLADAKAIRLDVVLDPSASRVTGDPDRLQQVVWNLLSNAIKFTPEEGRVEIRLDQLEAVARITVTDTGMGISPDFLPYVFDRFRQAEIPGARAHGGLGLGLAIVRHFVELHGGAVRAESGGEGRGARFTVELPLTVARTASGRPPSISRRGAAPLEAGSLAGVRVLLVEDQADARELLTTVLRQAGADARAVPSVGEALETFQGFRPHVLVSDLGMPGEDGYALIRKVRALEPARRAIPAVALTAYAGAEDRRRALSAGFQLHVAKPVEPAVLAAAIAGLAKGRAGRSIRRR